MPDARGYTVRMPRPMNGRDRYLTSGIFFFVFAGGFAYLTITKDQAFILGIVMVGLITFVYMMSIVCPKCGTPYVLRWSSKLSESAKHNESLCGKCGERVP